MRQNQDITSRLAAIEFYKIRKSLNIFEVEGWAAWCYKINLAWKIFLVKLFERVLLNDIYRKIKIDIYAAVNTCTFFRYMTNGFSNIRHNSIVNLFVHNQIRVFQLELEKISPIKHSAPELAR